MQGDTRIQFGKTTQTLMDLVVVLYLLQEFKPTLFQDRSDESAMSVNDDYRLGSELVEHLAQQL